MDSETRAGAAIEVIPYESSLAGAWDDLVAASTNGTFLHTRRFIGYHGDRFDDRSLIALQNGQMVGVMAAAVDPGDSSVVVSHPGLSYGGIVRSSKLTAGDIDAVVSGVIAHYRGQGFSSLRYKPVPAMYHARPAQDDEWALYRAGARVVRLDLGVAIYNPKRFPLNSNRRRSLKRAVNNGIVLSRDRAHYASYWEVLAERLAQRHGAKPVHTLAEIEYIQGLFPDEVELISALVGDEVAAGVVLFRSPTVTTAQYIASNEEGRRLSALDLVFEDAIGESIRRGDGWFNFGISTEQGGTVLNESLYDYKFSFGAGGVTQSHYELAIS